MDVKSWESLSRDISRLPSGLSETVKVRDQTLPVNVGVIAGFDPAGVGIIVDAERREHPFTFAAIVRYRGQSAATLGLKVGQQVKFVLLGEKVALVEPYTQAQAAAAIASTTIPDSRP